MAEQTLIEWADATLNLWWGCTKVSEGCKFCYAENLSEQRFGKGAWGPQGKRQEVKSWRSTLEKISRRAKAEGRRLRVFCQSMSDIFEGPETCGGFGSENWALIHRLRVDLFAEIVKHPELDFLLLTKRPHIVGGCMGTVGFWLEVNAALWRDAHSVLPGGLGDYACGRKVLPNVWIGTSVEDQKTADERIPHLLSIDCVVRFVSCEPLLGPIEFVGEGFCCRRCGRLHPNQWEDDTQPCAHCGCSYWVYDLPSDHATFGSGDSTLDWVICGGESGPNARPMHPDWARSLRDQCQAAGVPFLFKQWGEWLPDSHVYDGCETNYGKAPTHHWEDGFSWRVGKKAAGRLLDGREWNELPEVQGNV